MGPDNVARQRTISKNKNSSKIVMIHLMMYHNLTPHYSATAVITPPSRIIQCEM